jgi:hypothetical protein
MTLANGLYPNKTKWVKKGGQVSLDKEEIASQNVTEIKESETK